VSARRIVMFNQVSADGFFSDPEGGLDWIVSDPEIHARAVQSMPQTDTILFGRKTYQQFASFWPGALKNLDAAGPHGANKRDPAFAAMAHWLNDSNKLVFSRSMTTATWNNSEICSVIDSERLNQLKQQPGKDMLIFGSGSLVSQLSEHGLIDEYRFVVCPVLLGQGQPLLGQMTKRVSLKLVKAEPFRSGNVLLTYQRADG
jgi:dihydrofolate reductase